jgi:hypothetical protein
MGGGWESPAQRKVAVVKVQNSYAELLPKDFYAYTPKAVFAAIAVSLATHGDPFNGEHGGPLAEVLREWTILHQNGIVPQAPFKARP